MNPKNTCWMHGSYFRPSCQDCSAAQSDNALAELRRKLSGDEGKGKVTTRESALRDLAEAVKVARRFGLKVEATVTETVVTSL